MSESIITISIAGLLAGFIFSMPIAGPISILVVSNSLKGKVRYCNLLALGASFADLVFVFVAVYGITRFYSEYKPAIPYIMMAGALFIFYMSYRIARTKIDFEHIDEKVHVAEAIKRGGSGGFYTGLLVNFLNPTLFFGWLTSSFLVITIVSSLGFNTGGLDTMIGQSITEINNIGGNVVTKPELPGYLKFDTLPMLKKTSPAIVPASVLPYNYHMIISLSYAAALSLGSIIWFMLLTQLIYRCRKWISVNTLNLVINSLGIVLGLFGMFIFYKAITMIS
ncbi:MAG: LysE family transporter [Bacteroidales bacterium]|nr:LysE family transporter [Bacteroidales bacterium]